MKVGVVTGSQTCLPQELSREYGVTILPYSLELGGETYRDGVDISSGEFYLMMAATDATPHTAAISPGQYLEAFERLSGENDGILVVTVSSTFSATYNNAILAGRLFGSLPVEVVDSRTAAMAQGFAVIEAAKAAAGGASLGDCVEIAQRSAGDTGLYAYIGTFEYLRRSGRVDAFRAIAASALSIKPVFRLAGGVAEFSARRRSAGRARDYIADELTRESELAGGLEVAVFHAGAPREAEELAGLIRKRARPKGDVLMTAFTPVMGAHTGPGTVGAAFIRPPRLTQ